jgi:hypothetical protein
MQRGLRCEGAYQQHYGDDGSRRQQANGALSTTADLGQGEHGYLLFHLQCRVIAAFTGSDATVEKKVAAGSRESVSRLPVPVNRCPTSQESLVYRFNLSFMSEQA